MHKLELHETAKQILTYFHKASRMLLIVFRSQRKQANVKPAPECSQPTPDTKVSLEQVSASVCTSRQRPTAHQSLLSSANEQMWGVMG